MIRKPAVVVAGFTLLVGIAAGAPRPKGGPKADAGIVGEWVIESQMVGGKPIRAATEVRYVFSADGNWTIIRGKSVFAADRGYSFDPHAKPLATIDLRTIAAEPRSAMPGIARIDGDTLTLCFHINGDQRPSAFDSRPGTDTNLIVLKRLRKPE